MTADYTFRGLEAPQGKYLEILRHVLAPSKERKKVDLCCGLGFGKTVLAIQVAALALNSSPAQRGLFLEPDLDRSERTCPALW